jgi:hypothetical protein
MVPQLWPISEMYCRPSSSVRALAMSEVDMYYLELMLRIYYFAPSLFTQGVSYSKYLPHHNPTLYFISTGYILLLPSLSGVFNLTFYAFTNSSSSARVYLVPNRSPMNSSEASSGLPRSEYTIWSGDERHYQYYAGANYKVRWQRVTASNLAALG